MAKKNPNDPVLLTQLPTEELHALHAKQLKTIERPGIGTVGHGFWIGIKAVGVSVAAALGASKLLGVTTDNIWDAAFSGDAKQISAINKKVTGINIFTAVTAVGSAVYLVKKRNHLRREDAIETKNNIESILVSRAQSVAQPTLEPLNANDLAAHNAGLAAPSQNLGNFTAARLQPEAQAQPTLA